jgi:hypothetical protein
MALKNETPVRVTTAKSFRGKLSRYLAEYDHEPDLTGRLDKLEDTESTPHLINGIVLWNTRVQISRLTTFPILKTVGITRLLA